MSSSGGGNRIPVVYLYGMLEGGGTFLVRDDRQRPRFFIRSSAAAAAHALTGFEARPSDRHAFDGEPVAVLETGAPADVPGIRDALHAGGVETFEADVRFATRYLIERGIKGGCEIEGHATAGRGVDWQFDNPVVGPATVQVQPRVLSFDIETHGSPERLLAISLYANGIDEVLIVDGSGRPMPERATRCVDEYAALSAWCDRVRRVDPDVLTGWNIIDFDLTVLQRIAARVGHPFVVGRDEGATRIRKAEGYFGSGQATVPGRLVLDGIDLLRGAFIRMDDYSLDAVAREVLGEGKALAGEVGDRVAEISHNYRHDLPAFALYARTDARLALQILEKLDVLNLAFARSRLAGMTPDRVAASIASFDFLYLSELDKRAIVAPTLRGAVEGPAVAQQGGHVLEPVTGLHDDVWVFDFKSLYPSVIRTFNIDPLSFVAEPVIGDDLIRTPAGSFRREPAILPGLLDQLFPLREAAKAAGDAVAANATKILMNSFYGVLGTSACRFFNPALANSITGMGRELLLWSKRWFEAAGHEVIYGDTDSLFVRARGSDSRGGHPRGFQPPRLRENGEAMAAALTTDLARHVADVWRVTSRLELKFEKLYLKLLLPRARNSLRGASKRYAGLREDGERLEFVGMETVRRDWTALAKEVQRELYRRLFLDQPVEAYLSEVVRQVRAGSFDDSLVYRKNLRKVAEEYTATTPPHVVAARKSKRPSGRLVSYVMTGGGPEPLDNVTHPLDREHYVQKQVRPVAEPILATLGLDFERVIGDSRQFEMSLFGEVGE